MLTTKVENDDLFFNWGRISKYNIKEFRVSKFPFDVQIITKHKVEYLTTKDLSHKKGRYFQLENISFIGFDRFSHTDTDTDMV